MAALSLILANGLPARLNARAAAINSAVGTNFRCDVTDYLAFGAGRACEMNLPSHDPADADVILIGNSHAQMYEPLVDEIIRSRGLTGLLVPANGCVPALGVNINSACHRIAEENIEAVAEQKRAKIVIIALNWDEAAETLVDRNTRTLAVQGSAGLVPGVAAAVDRLKAAGKSVIVVGPISIPGYDIASETSRTLAFGRETKHPLSIARSTFEARNAAVLRYFSQRADIQFVTPHLTQCDSEKCYHIRGDRSLFADSNHLSGSALPAFRGQFENAISAALASHAKAR